MINLMGSVKRPKQREKDSPSIGIARLEDKLGNSYSKRVQRLITHSVDPHIRKALLCVTEPIPKNTILYFCKKQPYKIPDSVLKRTNRSRATSLEETMQEQLRFIRKVSDQDYLFTPLPQTLAQPFTPRSTEQYLMFRPRLQTLMASRGQQVKTQPQEQSFEDLRALFKTIKVDNSNEFRRRVKAEDQQLRKRLLFNQSLKVQFQPFYRKIYGRQKHKVKPPQDITLQQDSRLAACQQRVMAQNRNLSVQVRAQLANKLFEIKQQINRGRSLSVRRSKTVRSTQKSR